MPDEWYYDASESPRHKDAEIVYPEPDHPELEGAAIVRAMQRVPSGVTKYGGDGDSDEDSNAETCQAVKTDGEVCGRELPCAYHS